MAIKCAFVFSCLSVVSGENFWDGAARNGFIRRRPSDALSKETGKLSEASARMAARAMQQNQDNLKAVAQLQDKSARELKLDSLIDEGVIHAKTRANQRREMAWLEELNQTRLAEAENNQGKESAADAQKRLEVMDVQLTREAESLHSRQQSFIQALAKVRKTRETAQHKAVQIKAAEAKTRSELQKKLDLVRQQQAEQADKSQADLALVTKEEKRVIAREKVIGAEIAAARAKAEEAAAAESKARQEETAKDLANWEKEKATLTESQAEMEAHADLDEKKRAKMKAAFKQWAGTRVSEKKSEGIADKLSRLKGADRLAEEVDKENIETLKAIQAERARKEAEKLRKGKQTELNVAKDALDNRAIIAAKLDGDAAAQAKAEVVAREEAAQAAEEAELSDPESAAAAEAEAQREAEAFLKERRSLKAAMAEEHVGDK